MLLLSSSLVYIYSESANEAVSSTVETRNTDESPLVGLAEGEFWPVLRVSFPAKPFPNSQLGHLLEGHNSAQQYISEIHGHPRMRSLTGGPIPMQKETLEQTQEALEN